MNPGIMFKWSCNVSHITWYKISARSNPNIHTGLVLGGKVNFLAPRHGPTFREPRDLLHQSLKMYRT